MKLAASNLSNCKMLQEKQKSYLLDQKFLILCFYLHILEKELKKRNLLSYLKSAPSNLSNLKMCKIWTKNTLLKYFWGKTLKRIVLFKISFLKFASLQNFLRKQKSLTLGPKMADWVFLTKNALSVYFKARVF